MKRITKVQYNFLGDINPVVRFLILSDTVFMGATGLLGPIFALFITDFIAGGNAAVAGLAAGIYLFTKSIFQIPLAYIIDRIRGEKDDFWVMFTCTILTSLVPLLYLIIHTPAQLYLVQFLLGLFTALTFPTFTAIFTRHMDRDKEGTEWGMYYTFTDLSTAGFSVIGGYVATVSGYRPLILIVVAISLLGALFLYPVRPYIRMPKK